MFKDSTVDFSLFFVYFLFFWSLFFPSFLHLFYLLWVNLLWVGIDWQGANWWKISIYLGRSMGTWEYALVKTHQIVCTLMSYVLYFIFLPANYTSKNCKQIYMLTGESVLHSNNINNSETTFHVSWSWANVYLY